MGQILTDIAAAPITEGGRKQQEVPLETTMLVVENMHCGGCMRKVEQALSSEPGVISARANLSARRVTVVSEKGRRSAEDLIEALAKAGYKAAPLLDDTADTGHADQQFLRTHAADLQTQNAAFVAKPFDLDVLLDVIERALAPDAG